jgi:hypothetical protein
LALALTQENARGGDWLAHGANAELVLGRHQLLASDVAVAETGRVFKLLVPRNCHPEARNVKFTHKSGMKILIFTVSYILT